MILDSNIILDLLYPESPWNSWSGRWFMHFATQSQLVVNAVIFSESFANMATASAAISSMQALGLNLEAISPEAAHAAGKAHLVNRRRGGVRARTLADFLVGAHAATRGHSILTRDPARYRSYFPDLDIIAPDSHP